jgi:hypothetical protein
VRRSYGLTIIPGFIRTSLGIQKYVVGNTETHGQDEDRMSQSSERRWFNRLTCKYVSVPLSLSKVFLKVFHLSAYSHYITLHVSTGMVSIGS